MFSRHSYSQQPHKSHRQFHRSATLAGALLLVAGFGVPAARADNLYALHWASNGQDTVEKFTSGGKQSRFVADIVLSLRNPQPPPMNGSYLPVRPFHTVAGPSSLAFDQAGNLYVANIRGGTIMKFTQDGTPSIFSKDLARPTGLAFDRAGNLYVELAETSTILRLTPSGEKSVFMKCDFKAGNSVFNCPEGGLAFDSAGNLYVAYRSPGAIAKFTPAGEHTIIEGSGDPALQKNSGPIRSLACDRLDNLYVAEGLAIRKFTPEGKGSIFVQYEKSLAANGLAFDRAGNLCASLNDGTIVRYETDGTATRFASTGFIGADSKLGLTALAFASDDNVPFLPQ